MNTTEQSLIPLIDKEFSGEFIKTISARDLWKFLEIQSNFSTWIKRRIDEYGFKENEDWVAFQNWNADSTQIVSIDYFITIK